MTLSSLFEVCQPRQDVLRGSIAETDFAADLAQVLRGQAPEEYADPAKFFANTHPTRGLKDLLRNVCLRLSGSSDQVASIFRLDTNYGGGKTHALIALTHAARGAGQVPNLGEFIDPARLPRGRVRVAAFDGENADPANGRPLPDGGRAYTPWGEIAYALAGRAGYETIRRSDEAGVAPGADTIRELFGGEPTLILIDELSIYLRKLRGLDRTRGAEQLTAFMTDLFKAVEATPNAALVYTLAIGKQDRRAIDAYAEENEVIARAMEEAESVSARKAALLDPTEDDETVKVLRRRLFEVVDDERAAEIVAAYRRLWDAHREHLPAVGVGDRRIEAFVAGFPLHPELIETLKEKTSTLGNFQRVRGMLRLLARTIGRLWAAQPKDASAVHLHHIDLAHEPIRQEIVTRLGQRALAPAIRADVAAVEGDQPALAQQIDAEHYVGLPPYASYVARTILFHTLAFNEPLKGVSQDHLRYAILSPGTDISFIDDAVRRFVQSSAYLDDRPNVPLRFLHEANLTQIIRRQEREVDPGEVRTQLDDRIREIFKGAVLEPVHFPAGPYEVPDDDGRGKPYLVMLGFDAAEVDPADPRLPELVARIYDRKGAGGELRLNRNNLVFVVVDAARKDEMRRRMVRRLALDALRQPERLSELAEHQRDKIQELYRRSEQEVALAVQQAYRHVFYPSRHRLEGAEVDLAHTAIDTPSSSANPGDGQRQVVRVLQDNNKLRLPDDQPDAPSYVRDRTPLRKGQITTASLRTEFRRDPALPMLVGDNVFLKGIRQGIEAGEYVYRNGDLIWAQGQPYAEVKIDEQSILYTAAYAREHGIWPRPDPVTPTPADKGESPIEVRTGAAASADGGPQGRAEAGAPGGAAAPSSPDSRITAEAVLKEALTRIWEQARARRFARITTLELRLYEAPDAFRLLGLVGAIQRAEKRVGIEGGYETAEGSACQVEFNGTISDAQPLKDFLDPQLRAATRPDLKMTFQLAFHEGGLPLAGDEPEKMTERLCRFGAGAAFVAATAEGEA